MKLIHALCFVAVASACIYCRPVMAQGAGPADQSAAEIQKDMDAQHINFSFENRPLIKVIRDLRKLTTVNILYYRIPDEDIPITVDLKDTTVRVALDTICKLGRHDLDFEVIQGAVVVAYKPTLLVLRAKKPALPPNPGAEEQETLKKLDQKVDFRFADDKMEDACKILSERTGVSIIAALPREGEEFPHVNLALARVTLGQALFHLTGLKFNYGVFGSQIVISDDVGLALRRAR